MKTLMLLALGITTTAIASEPNYSKGFCVEEGKQLSPKNAFLTVNGSTINDDLYIMAQENHDFFDPHGETKILSAFNWGGRLRLEKTQVHTNGTFAATYYNHLHGRNIPDTRLLCVVEGGEPFIAEGSARFSFWSSMDYCEGARSVAHANAQQQCAPRVARRTADFVEKIIYAPSKCTASAEYVCEE
jgi:hypothetical protein